MIGCAPRTWEEECIDMHIRRWLAMHFGKRMEWNGPTVYGVGYLWCGKIWWEQPKKV